MPFTASVPAPVTEMLCVVPWPSVGPQRGRMATVCTGAAVRCETGPNGSVKGMSKRSFSGVLIVELKDTNKKHHQKTKQSTMIYQSRVAICRAVMSTHVQIYSIKLNKLYSNYCLLKHLIQTTAFTQHKQSIQQFLRCGPGDLAERGRPG